MIQECKFSTILLKPPGGTKEEKIDFHPDLSINTPLKKEECPFFNYCKKKGKCISIYKTPTNDVAENIIINKFGIEKYGG